MRTRTVLAALALAPALLFAAACGDDDDSDQPSPTAATSEATATTPGGTPAVETPAGTPGAFTGGTQPVEATPPAGLTSATLKTLRAAAQAGFDRIVFEFEGNQLPGYRVEYGDKAVNCASGADLTDFLGGGKAPPAILIVDMRPAAAHTEAGEATAQRDLSVDLQTITRAFRTCDFEGVVVFAVALTAEQPFKVSTLPNPPRLVIDIAQ